MRKQNTNIQSKKETMEVFKDDALTGCSTRRGSLTTTDIENQDEIVDDISIDLDEISTSRGPDDSDRPGQEKEKISIAQSETKQVLCLRITLAMVLVLVASFVSWAVYQSSKKSELNEFEIYARESCEKVTSSFRSGAASRLSAIESLAKSISSNAAAQGLTWPFVTVPNFEERLSLTMDLAEVMSIILLPLVTGENLERWNGYSLAKQGWLNESLSYQTSTGTNHSEWQDDVKLMEAAVGSSRPDNSISEAVYQLEGSNFSAAAEDAPFLPWWQFAPAIPVSALVNFDAFSHPSRRYQLRAVLENREALVSEAWDYSDDENPATYGKKIVLNLFLRQWQEGGSQYQYGPVSDLYYPVFSRDEHGQETAEVSAILTAYVYWQIYFEDILPPHSEPVVAILENICGDQERVDGHHEHIHKQQRQLKDDHKNEHQQQFSYLIRGGTAEYLGPGDHHDVRYDYLGSSTDHHAFLAGTANEDDLMEGQCIYRVRVYPTKEMQDNVSTQQPLVFMLIVLSTFVVTSLIFFAYDYYVEQRQDVVLTKAIKSTEVVQELFPANVRSRLFDDSAKESATSTPRLFSNSSEVMTIDSSASVTGIGSSGKTQPESDHGDKNNGPMVADLYKDCSVLFADLSGFTKWSNGREPTDIFRLLETLYGAFDKIAKRRGAFKVETIGDCYLATAGVPYPKKDHAVILSKFALDCMEKMDHLINSKLASQLGEDTKDLKLRVGIHSGEVTAGVLRGERARFQLFGDTVNTASRMESLSLPGKIQVSSATAALLKAANKGYWLFPREGGVEAKGKGRMTTFWVQPSKRSARRVLSASSVSTGGFSGESEMSEMSDFTPRPAAARKSLLLGSSISTGGFASRGSEFFDEATTDVWI